METRQIEFAKLRHAYIIVREFIDNEAVGYNKLKSLDTKIRTDLGLSGDDNLELLEKFIDKFELDYEYFIYNNHFYTEGELYGSRTALLNLLTLSIWLPLKTIELLTFNKIKIDKPKFPVTPDREVSDLTFKDLLTWYIEKEFKPNIKIKYVIKPSSEDS